MKNIFYSIQKDVYLSVDILVENLSFLAVAKFESEPGVDIATFLNI